MTEAALFSQLDLDPRIERAVTEMGFSEATAIQSAAIPLIRTGVDVIARSQTGTGKTIAFGIPALEVVDTKEEKSTVQVLILCPTRELAQQAGDEVRKLARFLPGIRPVEVYGGADMQRQFIKLRQANIVIGTPGRLMDHMSRGTLKLENLKLLVLDEADEMLKMGFKEDIEAILKDTPAQRQTVLFSATMPPLIQALTKQFQKDPQLIEINKSQVTIDNIDQRLVEVPVARKMEALCLLLRYHRPNRTLVFCNTKRMVDELAEYLVQSGYAAESIHGDLKQSQRTSVMNRFKQGQVSILVATDVAARGIDVNDIDYVFNYDIPLKTEEYVHRIGRTGRAGKSGCAVTLCCGRRQIGMMQRVSREVNSQITEEWLPTAEDLKKRVYELNLEQMRIALSKDTQAYESMVEALSAEGFIPQQIAAAALMGLFPEEKIEVVAAPPSRRPMERMERTDRTERLGRTGRPDRSERADRVKKGVRSTSSFVDVVIDVGADHHVTPNHLVGAITEHAGISSKSIGKIEVNFDQSVVGIAADCLAQVMDTIQGIKVCGKQITTVPLATVSKSKNRSPRKSKVRHIPFH